MAPLPAGFAQCAVELSYATLTRSAFVTFGVDNTENDLDADNVASAVASAWMQNGSINTGFGHQVTNRVVTVRLGTDTGEPEIGTHTINNGGGGDNSPPAANVAVILTKNTARGGRRGRGRMFIPWWYDDVDIDGAGLILPGSMASRQGFANLFHGALGAAGIPMVLLHSEGKTAEGPPTPVTSLTLQNRVGTQRRRLGR